MRPAHHHGDEHGRVLLRIARETLEEAFGGPAGAPHDEPWLWERGACFVTLHRVGELRGCIGTITAYRPLIHDLRANARAAAFEDGRFPALRREELPGTEIEVSLLSPLEEIAAAAEEELLAALVPGEDGVLLQCGGARGTFLPQVWTSLPERHEFLAQLKRKAGLPADFWSPRLKAWRYRVQKWSE